MKRASPLLLVLVATGFFLVTYNVLTTVINYRSPATTGELSDDESVLRLVTDPIVEKPKNLRSEKGSKSSRFHVALTATDAPYSKWQCRIMYYWYKKQKDLPGSDMGGFTRILHSGSPDNLMDEIPSLVVDPLPAGLDRVIDATSLFSFFYFFVWRFALLLVCPIVMSSLATRRVWGRIVHLIDDGTRLVA